MERILNEVTDTPTESSAPRGAIATDRTTDVRGAAPAGGKREFNDQLATLCEVLGLTAITSPTLVPANTPLELEVFAAVGVDEVVCGRVVHDPCLSHDPPLALFSPNEGVADYLGVDTRRSLGVLLGMRLGGFGRLECASGGSVKQIEQAAAELGFSLEGLPVEQPLGLLPRLPPGWRLAMTADGLGVAARAEQFAPGQEFQHAVEAFDPDEHLPDTRVVYDDLDAGHPATALWRVRNAAVMWPGSAVDLRIRELLRRAYLDLGRPGLANRVGQ